MASGATLRRDVLRCQITCFRWTCDHIGGNRCGQHPHRQSGVRCRYEPHRRDPEREEDGGNRDGFRPYGEATSGSPVADNPAEEAIGDEPMIEPVGRLREEEGCQQDRTRGWDARNRHTYEGDSHPQPTESHEHTTKNRVLDDCHDDERRQAFPRQHVGSKVGACEIG